MPRQKVYESNAERQAAYRARQAERRRLVESETVVERLGELERAVAEAERRALTADRRAIRAEERLQSVLDRHQSSAQQVPAARLPGGYVGGMTLNEAMAYISDLEAVVEDLTGRLAEKGARAPAPAPPDEGRRLNRAARRQAERDQRRRH